MAESMFNSKLCAGGDIIVVRGSAHHSSVRIWLGIGEEEKDPGNGTQESKCHAKEGNHEESHPGTFGPE